MWHTPSWTHISTSWQILSLSPIIVPLEAFPHFVFYRRHPTSPSPSVLFSAAAAAFFFFFFWRVNTHANLLSLSTVTAATARQRNTIHDRVVQIARHSCLPSSQEEGGGGEAHEIGWIKKKAKKKAKEEVVERAERECGNGGWQLERCWCDFPVHRVLTLLTSLECHPCVRVIVVPCSVYRSCSSSRKRRRPKASLKAMQKAAS